MEKASDEVLKQVLVNSDEKQMKLLCLTNIRFSKYCSKPYNIEAVYNQKCENQFEEKIIKLKDRNMTWKEFYERIINFQKNPLTVTNYCETGGLLEIKLYANMTPPILPTSLDAHWAAREGHLDVLKYCIETLKIEIEDGPLAAYWAAEKGHLNVLKYLVDTLRIEIYNGPLAAYWAAREGHLSVLKYLIETLKIQIKDGPLAAYWAAINGHLDVLKYLVETHKIQIEDGSEAAYWAAQKGYKDVVNYLASLNPPIYPNLNL